MWKADEVRKRKRFAWMLAYVQSPLVRWTLTLGCTAFATLLLLSPADGQTIAWLSALIRGTDITNTLGHVVISLILALVWCWTVSLHVPRGKAIRLILIGGLVWCFAAELAQLFVPERGTSLLDLGANILGVLIGLVVYRLIVMGWQ